ncbi:MAG: hypothetical protein HRU14_09560 [Planctomycetes bacterium]|nr:hypothetical protein [Planctomycetota bacterium]
MDDAVAERFHEDEGPVSVPGLDSLDRARFGRLVRQCVANWLLHPRVGLRVTRGKYGMALQFEGPLGDKMVSIFSLRAHHKTAEYRFVGPNPDRGRLGLDTAALESLDRLRDLYEALLSGKEGTGETVNCVLNGTRTPDLVPLVEETRRTLDGGHDTATASIAKPRSRVRAKPEPTPAALPTQPEPPSPEEEPERPVTVAELRFACPEPKAIVEFWGRVLKRRPDERHGEEGGVFHLGDLVLVITGELDTRTRKEWGYGSSKVLGQGLVPTLRVSDFDLCLRRARRIGNAIVDENRKAGRFLVKDPAGFVIEIARS